VHWSGRALRLAVSVPLLIGAAGCNPALSPQGAELALARAQRLAGQGKTDDAIDALYALTERSPNYAEAHLLYIELRARTARAVVQREYERKLKAEPENALLYFLLGHTLADPAARVKHYRKAVELEPELALAHLELGRACRSKAVSDLAASRRALEAAVSLRPNWAQAHLELARTLSAQGQMPEAVAAYRRVIELVAQAPSPWPHGQDARATEEAAWFELACLTSRDDPAGTEKSLAEAVVRCPTSGRLWWHLADFRWARGAWAEAAPALERALALAADASWAPEARDRLAAHYLCRGWQRSARRLGTTAWTDAAQEMADRRLPAEAFRALFEASRPAVAGRADRLARAARLAPRSVVVQRRLADALFAAASFGPAAAAYAEVVASRPADTDARLRQAEAELLAGDPAAALATLGPDRRRISQEAAWLVADAGALAAGRLSAEAIAARCHRRDADATAPEERQRALRDCIARFPSYLTPRLELARSLREAGNAAEARAVLEAAARIKGHPLAEADLQMQLGDLALADKRLPDAIARYKAAVTLCPDTARQHGALARACAADEQFGPAYEALTRQLLLFPHSYDLPDSAPPGRGQGHLLVPRLEPGDVFRYRYSTDGGQPRRSLARMEFDYVVETAAGGGLAEAALEIAVVTGRPVEGGKDFVGARPYVKCSSFFGLIGADKSARGMPAEFADLLWLAQFLHGPTLPTRQWPGHRWRPTQWTALGQPCAGQVTFERVRRGKALLSVAVSREGQAADPTTDLDRVAATGRAAIVFDLARQVVERVEITLHRTLADGRGSRAELPPWLHRLELLRVERGARRTLLPRGS